MPGVVSMRLALLIWGFTFFFAYGSGWRDARKVWMERGGKMAATIFKEFLRVLSIKHPEITRNEQMAIYDEAATRLKRRVTA